MGMTEGRATLRKSMKELQMHWNETKAQWRDSNAAGFETRFLVPMEMDAKMAISAMDQMAAVLQKIKQECGE